MHCSFYLYFIEKPVKCTSEEIPLQKISIVCSHLMGVIFSIESGDVRSWRGYLKAYRCVQVKLAGGGGGSKPTVFMGTYFINGP